MTTNAEAILAAAETHAAELAESLTADRYSNVWVKEGRFEVTFSHASGFTYYKQMANLTRDAALQLIANSKA